MIDYERYAIRFCRELQKIEKGIDEVSVDTLDLIRNFKRELGYSIPESLEEGTGSTISINRKE